MTKCLTPNCHYQVAPALGSGLCMRCHSKAKEAVENGLTSWDELIGLGLALSKADAGGDPFNVALRKKMEGNDVS